LIIKFDGILPTIHVSVFVSETAAVIGDVHIRMNSSVWYSAVIRGDMHSIRIGERTNIQDGAILHVVKGTFPCLIGDDVTIGHAAVVHGCTVHDKVLIGMNATVLDGAIIEEGAIIAAGALIREGERVPANRLFAGVPARDIRATTDEDFKRIINGSEEYVHYGARFKEETISS